MKRPFVPQEANLTGPDPFGRPPKNPRIRPAANKKNNGNKKDEAVRGVPVGRLAKRAAKAGAVLAVDTINRKAAEAVESLEGRVIR